MKIAHRRLGTSRGQDQSYTQSAASEEHILTPIYKYESQSSKDIPMDVVAETGSLHVTIHFECPPCLVYVHTIWSVGPRELPRGIAYTAPRELQAAKMDLKAANACCHRRDSRGDSSLKRSPATCP